MVCPDEDVIQEYLQGRLDRSSELLVEQHIDSCSTCRSLVAHLAKSLSSSLWSQQLPSDRNDLATQSKHDSHLSDLSFQDFFEYGLQPDSMVDHFRIMRLLGRGGMSEVYLARDTRLGRKVALKLIHPEVMGTAEDRARFLFEAQTTAQFNHPHIIAIYHVGEYQGFPYLALEYLDGQTLRDRMRHERLSYTECMRIGLAIALALREAHGHRILHRDLKPENIIIAKDGRLRVLDFGLAKALVNTDPRTEREGSYPGVGDPRLRELFQTQGGWIRGTPAYMSPEQWRQEESSTASDIWALGIILYELLSGRHPYPPMNTTQLRSSVLCPEHLAQLPPHNDLPQELSELVSRCLEKIANQRPSAAEVVERLERLLTPEGILRRAAEENPFRGLMPFTEQESGLFFGREGEVANFLERLRDHAILPVVGPSGVGKSSFVQAGVIPRLKEQGRWTLLKMRPGRQPLQTLLSRLTRGESRMSSPGVSSNSSLQVESEDAFTNDELIDPHSLVSGKPSRSKLIRLMDEVCQNPRVLNLLLNQIAAATRSQILLFVDQFEELFTLVDDESIRHTFLRAILAAADDPEEPVRVVFTLREDFLGHLTRVAEGRDTLGQVTILGIPDASALEQALRRPLRLLGWEYDDPQLVSEMVASVKDEPAGLPLLEFAAAMLWDHRDPKQKRLLRSRYEMMGGVAGALARHADGVLKTLSAEQLQVARHLLLRLVTPERTRQVISRHYALEGLGKDADGVLERLTKARLISVRQVQREGVIESELELAHESLIQTWGQLAQWIDESRAELRMLAEISQAAELWEKRGRPHEEVWQGEALHEAQRILGSSTSQLPERARQFLAAGRNREERRVRRRRIIWGTSMTMLGLISLASLAVSWVIDEQRQEARLRWAEAQRESARVDYLQENILEARAKLRGALEMQDSVAARALWWRISQNPMIWEKRINVDANFMAISPNGRQLAIPTSGRIVYLYDLPSLNSKVLRGYSDQAICATYSPDGSMLAITEYAGFVHLYNLTTDQHVKLFSGSKVPALFAVAFSPDGRLLASGHTDGGVRVWDTRAGRLKRIFKGHRKIVTRVTFSNDGRFLASGGLDQTIRLWDIGSGKLHKVLEGLNSTVLALTFDQQSRLLYSASGTELRRWAVDTGQEQEAWRHTIDPFFLADFHRASNRLAFITTDKAIRVLNLPEGTEFRRYKKKMANSLRLAFSPDGNYLASYSDDNTIQLWDLRVPSESSRLTSHPSQVTFLAASPTGQQLATGGYDHIVRLWDTNTGLVLNHLIGHTDKINAVSFSPDGRLLASASDDGTVRVWNIAKRKTINNFNVSDRRALALAISPNGKFLATSGTGLMIKIWDISDGTLWKALRPSAEIKDSSTTTLSFSPDSNLLAAALTGGGIYLWDIHTGRTQRALLQHQQRVHSLAFMPDGRHLISSCHDHTIREWDITTGNSRLLAEMDGRAYGIDRDFSGKNLGVATSTGIVTILNAENKPRVLLRGHRGEVNDIKFMKDGLHAGTVSDDGTVRFWETNTGRPVWRAPLLRSQHAVLFTHQGWINLNQGNTAPSSSPSLLPRSSTSHWRRAVEEEAWFADEEPRQHMLCLMSHNQELEIWDTKTDKLRYQTALAGLKNVRATSAGCLTLAQNHAQLFSSWGNRSPLSLARSAQAISWSSGTMLVADEKEVTLFDPSGKRQADYPVDPGVTAMLLMKSWLVLGYRDGNLELVPLHPESKKPVYSFEEVPRSAVERLLEGPLGTLIVGYSNGIVGIWNTENGAHLASARLHGPVIHLQQQGTKLYVGTELGDYRVMDLSAFHLSYCDLLHQIWQKVPMIWEGGIPVERNPPRDNPCFTSYQSPSR